MKRPMIVFGLIVVFAWGLVGWSARADESRRGSKSEPALESDAKPIHLTRCHIKLIDTAVLASDRPGIIAYVEPEEGDPVHAGQQVAGLRDEVAQAELAVAELEAKNDVEIRYAKKATEVAKAEHEVALEANRRVPKAVPEVEVNRLKLAAERSELQIERAEMDRDIAIEKRNEAEAQLKMYQIKATFDGVVTRVHKHEGEAVRQGDPILEIKSTDRVRVEGYVNIRDIWRVKRGDRVQVHLDIPDADLEVEKRVFEGKIVFPDVTADPVNKTVMVWAEVANPDNILRAGLPAVMTIWPEEPVAAAPTTLPQP